MPTAVAVTPRPLLLRGRVRLLAIGVLWLAIVSSMAGQSAGPELPTAVRSARTGQSYLLGPEDEITIKAMEAEELSGVNYRVDSSGNVRLPMIGAIHCTGLTIGELEQEVAKRLKTYIKNPQVSIRVVELRSRPVSVLGAVKKPGTQQLQGESTLMEMLSLAGGLDETAGNTIRIMRRIEWGRIPLPNAKDDATAQFSLADLSVKTVMGARSPETNIAVRPNDIITVPRGDIIYVIGEVHKAGGFPLREHEQFTVLEALSVAEGLKPTAKPASAKILRVDPASPNRKEINVNLQTIIAGKQSDITMQPDDILFVPNNLPRSAALRGLETAIQIGTGIVIWRR
jgi:polysaccharide export outer membrane protein